jgi:hypothetical protein
MMDVIEIKQEVEQEEEQEEEEEIIFYTSTIGKIKQKGINWIDNVLGGNITHTKPGSISHLLYGKKPSEQSINIKLGRFGEFISKELIKTKRNLELLHCGIQKINNKNKDVDLIFKDENNKIIYYRELKGNIELDTEKMQATVDKCKEIEETLKLEYSEYVINCGILNWSVYNRSILTSGISNIKTFETKGIKIDHMQDFLNIIDVSWDEDNYYSYFREIGQRIQTKFN